MAGDIPLPWERVLWRARPLSLVRRANGERYILTDLRLLVLTRDRVQELALGDIGEVSRSHSRLERLADASTLTIRTRRRHTAPIVLAGIRRASQLAALLELLSGDPRAASNPDSLRTALAWTPRPPAGDFRGALTSVVALPLAIAVVAAAVSLSGRAAPLVFDGDDAIAPNGERLSREAIVGFMQRDVLPWARETLGPLKGGADRVTCGTCHGAHPDAEQWAMPAVAALPRLDLRGRDWENHDGAPRRLDAQMRNAIYGYVADAEKQSRAAYMREVVVPGMARLLHRPAYDFTKPYEYNRARHALGCYQCHRVS